MARLTEYDEVRGIYKLKIDCNQGENIQKLGRLEDRDEVYHYEIPFEEGYHCGNCNHKFVDDMYFFFCPHCGQRLKAKKEVIKND